jgi:hypothetical protein
MGSSSGNHNATTSESRTHHHHHGSTSNNNSATGGRERAIEALIDREPQGDFYRAARVLVSSVCVMVVAWVGWLVSG